MERPRRTAPRLAGGLLACAVVPAMLIAGCSSGGSGGSDAGKDSASASTGAGAGSGTPTPTVAPVKYAALPASCKAVTASTVAALVPKAKNSQGTVATSSDTATRGGCSWTGNGKDGYQYRWLSVTLQRFANDPQLGSGEQQAQKRYAQQVGELGAVKGFNSTAVTGIGDRATSVAGRATVAKVTSQNDTVVALSGNVVVLVEYDGAGLVGKKNPSAATVVSGAERAAKDVVAALAAANA